MNTLTLHVCTEPLRGISKSSDETIRLCGMTLAEARAWIESADFDYPIDEAREWLAAYEAQNRVH